jgi:hypothetical protein
MRIPTFLPRKADKLISLATEFHRAGGRIVEARGIDMVVFRETAKDRRLADQENWPDDERKRLLAGCRNLEDALTPQSEYEPTHRFVALDHQGRVVGALNQSAVDGWVNEIGTTGEVRGTGAALLAMAALSSKQLEVELLTVRSARRYYARLGFKREGTGKKSATLRRMRLGEPKVVRIRRAAPQIMGL